MVHREVELAGAGDLIRQAEKELQAELGILLALTGGLGRCLVYGAAVFHRNLTLWSSLLVDLVKFAVRRMGGRIAIAAHLPLPAPDGAEVRLATDRRDDRECGGRPSSGGPRDSSEGKA